ncbi:DUF3489 domain-containing protein [Limobrevibacterium gyesilva]|uniref:DUF3489 domain-containing protein n=1 Tax=Limobrevibacterium gyesilva TaxID=2991712 RepID=A0AA41YLK3_9PROT|nr:DUF3489 domain-containing protein [Limobrevibacterium gyesilva]MCW3474915.1 DUF3489 domain-containing protein [Limobrevibacterium gyesilva]
MTKTQHTTRKRAIPATPPNKSARRPKQAPLQSPHHPARAIPAGRATKSATPETVGAAVAPKSRASKKAAITALLQREDGATITELVAATGWLGHSVRAALTGLRQDGHEIVRSTTANGATQYRIVAAA